MTLSIQPISTRRAIEVANDVWILTDEQWAERARWIGHWAFQHGFVKDDWFGPQLAADKWERDRSTEQWFRENGRPM